MRETKEQKMTRLERVNKEQAVELVEMRKERKSRNYLIQRLEKERDKYFADMKELQRKLDDAGEVNERLLAKLGLENVDHEDDIKKYKERIDFLEKEIQRKELEKIGAVREAVRNIVDGRLARTSNEVTNKIILQQYINGEMFYDRGMAIGEDGMVEKKPIFSADDLIIRINPKTGAELNKDEVSCIAAMLSKEAEYEIALCELGDYSCFHSGDELDVYAYNKGMELLELYKDVMF